MRAVSHGNGPEMAVSLTEKLTPTITRIEREMIKVALRANQGRVEATAKALGHLAQRALPETPAARRLISTGVVRLGLRFCLAQRRTHASKQGFDRRPQHTLRPAARPNGLQPPFPDPVVDRSPRHAQHRRGFRNQHAALSMRSIVLGHAGRIGAGKTPQPIDDQSGRKHQENREVRSRRDPSVSRSPFPLGS